MIKTYRPGATGALLDIYEQAVLDLKQTVELIPDYALTTITDWQTTDENCRSIQTILTHVVHAAYGYATSIYNSKGHELKRPGKTLHATVKEYVKDLSDVFSYTEHIFKKLKDDELRQLDESLKIITGWGQLYDIEQLMEHAVVHILRHQRQIEKIKAAGLEAVNPD